MAGMGVGLAGHARPSAVWDMPVVKGVAIHPSIHPSIHLSIHPSIHLATCFDVINPTTTTPTAESLGPVAAGEK
jgi:hypothetical protein